VGYLLVLFIPLTLLINTVFNALLLRRPLDIPQKFNGSVDVLIPLRNEEANLIGLLESLRSQVGIERIHFYLLDDNSTDNTYANLLAHIDEDSRFTALRGKELPSQWLGKPFALHQLIGQSDAETIVLIDADVRLAPHAIANSAVKMGQRNLDFVSIYPRQIALTFAERLIQPLLQWSWMSTVLLRIAERSSNPKLAVANGQFLICTSHALKEIGGFEQNKRAILDDIFLARTLLRQGFHGSVFDGSRIARCRMYSSWKQVRDGYTKSLWSGFGSIGGSFVAIAFLFSSSVLPFLMIILGFTWAWIGYVAIVLTRVISALSTQGRVRDSLLHPISALALIYLIVRSWAQRGRVQWKGRTL